MTMMMMTTIMRNRISCELWAVSCVGRLLDVFLGQWIFSI